MNQQDYISGLITRCYDASGADGWSEEEIQALFDEASAYEAMPVVGTKITYAINKRNFDMLAGALGMCLPATDSAPQVNVSSTNDNRSSSKSRSESASIASAFATYGDAVNAIEELDADESLKTELSELLVEVRKVKDNDSLARHSVKALLDSAIDHGFDAFAAVAPYAMGVAITCLGVA